MFPKHEPTKPAARNGSKKQPKPTATQAERTVPTLDLSDLAVPLERIAHSLKSYNYNATAGDNCLQVFSSPNGHPLRVVLECADVAAALNRIAAALEGKA